LFVVDSGTSEPARTGYHPARAVTPLCAPPTPSPGAFVSRIRTAAAAALVGAFALAGCAASPRRPALPDPGAVRLQRGGAHGACGGEGVLLDLAERTGRSLDAVALALDDERVYLVTREGELLALPKQNGPVTVLAPGPSIGKAIVAGSRDIYWSTVREFDARSGKAEGQNAIHRIPRQGGRAELVVATSGGASKLVLDATALYWRTPSGLYRAQLDGSGSKRIASVPEDALTDFVVDDDHVFWAVRGETLWRARKDGSQPLQLAADVALWTRLRQDAEHLYYQDDHRRVVKITKSSGRKQVLVGPKPVDPEQVDQLPAWEAAEALALSASFPGPDLDTTSQFVTDSLGHKLYKLARPNACPGAALAIDPAATDPLVPAPGRDD